MDTILYETIVGDMPVVVAYKPAPIDTIEIIAIRPRGSEQFVSIAPWEWRPLIEKCSTHFKNIVKL